MAMRDKIQRNAVSVLQPGESARSPSSKDAATGIDPAREGVGRGRLRPRERDRPQPSTQNLRPGLDPHPWQT
jgi:hypothetical protein